MNHKPTSAPQAAHDPSRRNFVIGTGSAIALGSTIGLAGCGGGGGGEVAKARFGFGVASGDPLSDRVIIWTRANQLSTSASVNWDVALDTGFSNIVRTGSAVADINNDSTVKVDVTGLQAATTYYYRFRMGSDTSETGRTRTLPVGSVAQVRVGVFSCAAFSIGQFHVYNHAANRTDLDAALMLGDYIYETGLTPAEQLAASESAATRSTPSGA